VQRAVAATQVANGPVADVIEVVTEDDPAPRPGWTVVEVRAAALNRHDLWAIRSGGVSSDRFPLGLGSDVAGVTAEGREVLVHALVAPDAAGASGELLDPGRLMLAEATTGACATHVAVPDRNLVDKPAALSFTAAACLPTAWLTAYSMLYRKAQIKPGQTVLVQGAAGGVATAAIVLARAGGARVWVAGRSRERLAAAVQIGAHDIFDTGARLPERVDVVIETVGSATWAHSVRVVRPGGVVVVAGATTGATVELDLSRIFLQHVSILGSTMGTLGDLRLLAQFCAVNGVIPPVDAVYPLATARAAVTRLESGEAIGKVLIDPSAG
jgi:NADPH:quinone reductase-like Zn-dependent oxidoreductase